MDETEKRRQQRRQILANGGDPFKETVSQDFVVFVVFHPDSGSRVKKGIGLTQKIVTDKFSEITSGMFIPDPEYGFFSIPVLNLRVKKHRILDPDTQKPDFFLHCGPELQTLQCTHF